MTPGNRRTTCSSPFSTRNGGDWVNRKTTFVVPSKAETVASTPIAGVSTRRAARVRAALVPRERHPEQGREDPREEVGVGKGGGAFAADGRGELDEPGVDDGDRRLRPEDRRVRPDLQLVGARGRLVRERPAEHRRDVADRDEGLSVRVRRPDDERGTRRGDERRRRRGGGEAGPRDGQGGQEGEAREEGGPDHSPGL